MKRLDEDSKLVVQFVLALSFATTLLIVMRLLNGN